MSILHALLVGLALGLALVTIGFFIFAPNTLGKHLEQVYYGYEIAREARTAETTQ